MRVLVGGAGQGGETVGEGVGGATLLPLSTRVPWLVVAMILAPLYRFSLLCERSALWLLHYTHALPLGWLLALASPAGLACRLGWLAGWLLACWLACWLAGFLAVLVGFLALLLCSASPFPSSLCMWGPRPGVLYDDSDDDLYDDDDSEAEAEEAEDAAGPS